MLMIPARESLTLGVLMNTKGLVELIVLNIGKEKKVSFIKIQAIFLMKISQVLSNSLVNFFPIFSFEMVTSRDTFCLYKLISQNNLEFNYL